jgi:hypothetical protein
MTTGIDVQTTLREAYDSLNEPQKVLFHLRIGEAVLGSPSRKDQLHDAVYESLDETQKAALSMMVDIATKERKQQEKRR